MQPIAVNARFLTRPPSGVDRVAMELVAALAPRLNQTSIPLLHPAGVPLHRDWLDSLAPDLAAWLVPQPIGRRTGHLWEQTELAGALPDHLLLSLCSTGPLTRRRQAVMIHDAQVWDVPESYSRSFRAAYRLLLPCLGRRMEHLLTVSAYSARRLRAVGVDPAGRARIVPNGADHILRVPSDTGALARLGLTAGRYILAIGSMAPHKNLRLLVAAAAARAPGGPTLVVAGGSNVSVFAEAGLAEDPGLRFLGRVEDSTLRALYEGAMALAFPSLTEGFGLPPVEAMLCGCPVVATTGGAVPEVCGDAVLSVEPMHQAAWTAALERIATDADLRRELSVKGAARAKAMTWARAADTMIGILGETGTGRSAA